MSERMRRNQKADQKWSGIALLLIVQILSTSLFLTGCAEEKPPGYYENEDGFSFILPSDWSYQEDAGAASVVLWKGVRDSLAPTITVVTLDLPPQATNQMLADLNFQEAATSPSFMGTGKVEVTIDTTTVPALVYSYKAGERWQQAFLASIVTGEDDEKKGYVFNCTTYPGRMEQEHEEFRKVLATFRAVD